MHSDIIMPTHLSRRALIYVRQSRPHQVLSNGESLRLQYALRQRAVELGWHEADVEVIDQDLGESGTTAVNRSGFKELLARIGLGEVGIVLSYEVTRLTRNCSDWYPLLDLCGYRRCLIADRDGGLRSVDRQRPIAAWPQGHDLRGGDAHAPRPAHRRAAGQGQPGRLGTAAPGRPRTRPDRGGRHYAGPRGGGSHSTGVLHIP
jgi:hypothetical protein